MAFQIMATAKLQKLFYKYNVPNFKNSIVCWPSACTSEFEHLSSCMDGMWFTESRLRRVRDLLYYYLIINLDYNIPNYCQK